MKTDPVQNSAQGNSGKSRDKLADLAHVSHHTYERGVDILENAPEPVKKAWQGRGVKGTQNSAGVNSSKSRGES